MAGDPTPRIHGRVTLDLTKHFEFIGTMMMILTMVSGVGIGWGKPAPINASKMRNPRWDLFAAVAAGPVSNLLQAVVYGVIGQIVIRSGGVLFMTDPRGFIGPAEGFLPALVFFGVWSNLGLATFNLIPIAPLDGHWLVGQLLSGPIQDKWYYYNRRIGPMLLLTVVLLGQFTHISIIGAIVSPVISRLARIILGL